MDTTILNFNEFVQRAISVRVLATTTHLLEGAECSLVSLLGFFNVHMAESVTEFFTAKSGRLAVAWDE